MCIVRNGGIGVCQIIDVGGSHIEEARGGMCDHSGIQ